MLDQYGVRWQGTRPFARLREAHEVMRTFLAEGRVDPQGEFYQYSGLFTAARPIQQPLPIKIGAMTGPGSFRLAGEIADGIHVACAYSSEALFFAAQKVREGADRVGRRLDSSFDLCASVLGAIAGDSAAAKETAAWPRPSTSHRWHLSSSSGTGSTMPTFGLSSTPLVAGMSSARWS